jgi:hypothetical protein
MHNFGLFSLANSSNHQLYLNPLKAATGNMWEIWILPILLRKCRGFCATQEWDRYISGRKFIKITIPESKGEMEVLLLHLILILDRVIAVPQIEKFCSTWPMIMSVWPGHQFDLYFKQSDFLDFVFVEIRNASASWPRFELLQSAWSGLWIWTWGLIHDTYIWYRAAPQVSLLHHTASVFLWTRDITTTVMIFLL